MDGTGEYATSSLDLDLDLDLELDALAVSDRFRLFSFTRRDDHLQLRAALEPDAGMDEAE